MNAAADLDHVRHRSTDTTLAAAAADAPIRQEQVHARRVAEDDRP